MPRSASLSVAAGFATCLGLIAAIALAQSPSTHQHAFRDAERWAPVFEDPKRDVWQKPDEVIRALELAPDATVADIGAGTGYFAVRLADSLPTGRVHAVDVEPDMVRYLAERARREKRENLMVRAGAPHDPQLPEKVDLVLMVDVYHHLDERERYFRRLGDYLKPGGRVAIVDFTPDSPMGPPRAARIAADRVRAELAGAGYALVREHRFLPNQYFLVFERAAAQSPDDDRALERRSMVEEIATMARATELHTGRNAFDDRVVAAMAKVPRHRFVPEHRASDAYRNRALPIGEGQTISQPFVVALSTDLLEPRAGDVVLEVGTGSGYQAAVLAELVRQVYSIEIVEPLGREAADRLRALGYDNVEVKIGDGYQGWPEKGPFDGIVVTAAAADVPAPLVDQLRPGGKMVIPVGPSSAEQELVLIEKRADGSVSRRSVLPVRFVPMTGEAQRPRR